MSERHPPRLDVPIVLGISTALYAASLAVVTGLQAGADADQRAETAPLELTLENLRSDRAVLEVDAELARRSLDRGIDGYDALATRVTLLNEELAELSAAVQSVSGSAAALSVPSLAQSAPTRIVRIVPAAAPPAAHATTGASGG
jgi:hypothetical protein